MFAGCIEGNMQSEELSKKMGDIILDPQIVKVDSISTKKLNIAKHTTGQEINLKVVMMNHTKVRLNVQNVV